MNIYFNKHFARLATQQDTPSHGLRTTALYFHFLFAKFQFTPYKYQENNDIAHKQ